MHVESASDALMSEKEKDNIAASLSLAEQMGAESLTIQGGTNIASDILAFARSRNVSRIIIGRDGKPWYSDLLFPSVSKKIIEQGQDFDITL